MGAARQKAICKIVIALALGNFFAFFVIAIHLGGDAVNGMSEGGRFFLMSHGRYTEVSECVFTYSLWHTYSVWVTHAVLLAAFFWHGTLVDT
jgi:hypothetical protein